MIPDTYCSQWGPDYGYQCPTGMKCVRINFPKPERGFNGFDEIGFLFYFLAFFKRIYQ